MQLLVKEFPGAAEQFNLLHSALRGQCAPEVIKFLIEKYPHSVCEEDENGNLALSIALSERGPQRPAVIKAVLDANPKAVKHQNKSGELPLQIAVRKKGRDLSVSVFKMLLEDFPECFENVLMLSSSLVFLAYHGVCAQSADGESVSWQGVNGPDQQCKPEVQELVAIMNKCPIRHFGLIHQIL